MLIMLKLIMRNSPSWSPKISPELSSSSSDSVSRPIGNAWNRMTRKEWYKKSELKEFGLRVREGDLVEIHRGKYQHWVVVVEVGEDGIWIIHLTGDKGIIKSKLEDELGDDECRINNENDETEGFVINAPNTIVNCAYHYYKFPKDFGDYHLLNRNCQHFANRCRYSQSVSRQVDKFTKPFAKTQKKQLIIN